MGIEYSVEYSHPSSQIAVLAYKPKIHPLEFLITGWLFVALGGLVHAPLVQKF